MLGAAIAAVGATLEASSVRLWMLVVGRLIAGGQSGTTSGGSILTFSAAGEGLFLGPCGGERGTFDARFGLLRI